jgi:hypothetical protein
MIPLPLISDRQDVWDYLCKIKAYGEVVDVLNVTCYGREPKRFINKIKELEKRQMRNKHEAKQRIECIANVYNSSVLSEKLGVKVLDDIRDAIDTLTPSNALVHLCELLSNNIMSESKTVIHNAVKHISDFKDETTLNHILLNGVDIALTRAKFKKRRIYEDS